ncbi:MAG: cytosine permease [Actinomycetota bacterium]|nr:cytosine permease [Actinomycetota bacterium]
MSLLSIGIRICRSRSALFDAVIGGAMSVYAVFIYNFTNSFEEFLSLMVTWLAPWAGIYLVDMVMRRFRCTSPALFGRSGPYWYQRGWTWRALAAFGLGIIAALLSVNAPLYRGPLIHLIGDGDISIYVGFVVSGLVYYVLTRQPIRAAASAVAAPESAGGPGLTPGAQPATDQ